MNSHSFDSVDSKEYLLFALGRERYAVDIQYVQEIRRYESATRIANAPSFVRGVLNLRGLIVPVLDLRLKLALEHARFDDNTVLIVLAVAGQTVGAIVDAVSDVAHIENSALKDPPEHLGSNGARFVTGIATVGDELVLVVDIHDVVRYADLSDIEHV
jgi:purine-binding chemotaxis protein CheW